MPAANQYNIMEATDKSWSKNPETFETLKSLLLDGDREERGIIKEDLQYLKAQLGEEQFRKLVSPIVNEYMEELRVNFPDLYGDIITQTISEQVRSSQGEMVDAMYPIVGKMVKRYAQAEMQSWLDAIDEASKKLKFLQVIKEKVLFFWRKRVRKQEVITKIIQDKIEEIFIIQKETGFILANYSEAGPFSLNKDMLAGMLTAIKAFGEDAMGENPENLNTIKYDGYNIMLFNFYSYYAAVIVNGPVNQSFQSDLQDKLFDFAQMHLQDIRESADQQSEKKLSQALKKLIRG